MKTEEFNKQLLDLAESLLDDMHTLNFRMLGNSMYPTLKDGDLGLVEKCSPDELKIGDIVVFKSHDKLVAHRLIDIFNQKNERVFFAKGDKNFYKDAPFTSDALVGKIISFQRKNKSKKLDSPLLKFQQFIALHFSKPVIFVYNFILGILNLFEILGSFFKSIKHNISVVAKHSEKILIINTIISILQGIIPFVIIVCIKALIDHLTSLSALNDSQQYQFIVLLVATALVFLASGILSEVRTYFSEKLSQSITHRIYEKLHWKHASLDLSHYENPAEQDKIHRAVQEASFRPIKIINELLTGIKSTAAALFLVGLFVAIKWY